jgi:serine protease Do
MRLIKLVSLAVAVAGLALVVAAVAPSVSGHSFDSAAAATSNGGPAQGDRAQTDRTERRRQRELTVLAGHGAEIGASIRDVEGSDKARAGVVVEDVRPDSPAEKAGLKRSDVIVEFDGETVRSARQFTRLVRETPSGRSVKATIVRDGARKDVQITPAEGRDSIVIDGDRIRERLGDLYERMPQFNFDFDLPFPFEARGRLGVSVQELTPQLAAYFGAKDGVLVTAITEDGPAARAGLKAGDVITKVNDTPVRSREDLVHALRDIKDDGQAAIGIVRDKRETNVTVKLESRRPARTSRPA